MPTGQDVHRCHERPHRAERKLVVGMGCALTCPATLADRGVIPCTNPAPHEIDADVTRDHEEDER